MKGSCNNQAACVLRDCVYVSARGCADHPDIAIVGEAPGRQERIRGKAFVGPAGELLDVVLMQAGADLERVYYTNAVMCCPPRNDTPSAAEAGACKQRLLTDLHAVRPAIVVPLGNVAIKSLLNLTAITRQRGIYREADGLGMLPTVHPAAVLRDPELYPDFLHDLTRAVEISSGRPAVVPVPYDSYVFITSQRQFDALIRRLRDLRGQPVAIDLETTGLDWASNEIVCVALSWRGETAVALDWDLIRDNLANFAALRECLEGVAAVCHNAQFDAQWLYAAGIHLNLHMDTMLAHHTVDERQGSHGLKRLAVDRYRAPVYDENLMPFIRRHRASAEGRPEVDTAEDTKTGLAITQADWAIPEVRQEVMKYNAADADYTFRLCRDLPREMEEDGVTQVHDEILIPAVRHFMEFERSGMQVDLEYAHSLGRDWKAELAKMELELHAFPGAEEINLRSVRDVSAYLYDTLNLKPMADPEVSGYVTQSALREAMEDVDDEEAQTYWRIHGRRGTDKLSVRSTGVYTLYWLAQQHDFPRVLIQHRLKSKRLSGVYGAILDVISPDGRVRPRYRLHGTRTGRLSSSAPNIHGIPREASIKDMFVADEGFVLLAADYAQAEVRMAAHFAKDTTLTRILGEGDVHQAIARELYGMTDATLNALTEDERGQYRRGAKNVTFGILYGRSAEGLAPQLGCSVREAEEVRARFLRMMPGVNAWMEGQRKLAVDEQEVRSLYGRVRRFGLITGRGYVASMVRQAINMPIQSSVSDMTLLANMHAMQRLRDAGIQARPWPHIHDGFIIQVDGHSAEAAVGIVAGEMHKPSFSTDVPFVVDIYVGTRWGHLVKTYAG